MDPAFAVLFIVILIFSVILHELAHGYSALWLGDPTAKLEGRLTLNPIPHIDFFGSILLPGILLLTNAPLLFGYAKPVPYNPYNLSNQRWGEAFVAFSGAGVNFIVAIFFGLLIRFAPEIGITSVTFLGLALTIVKLNILLGLFNLIPFPPLDGSKVLAAFLPFGMWQRYMTLTSSFEKYGPIAFIGFLLLFFYVLSAPFQALVGGIVGLLTGIPGL